MPAVSNLDKQMHYIVSWISIAEVSIDIHVGGRYQSQGRGRGRGFDDPEDIQFCRMLRGHTSGVTAILVDQSSGQVQKRASSHGGLLSISRSQISYFLLSQIFSSIQKMKIAYNLAVSG